MSESTNCMECPHHEVMPSPSGWFNWPNQVMCRAMNSKGCIRAYTNRACYKHIKPPTWCPLRKEP